MGDSQIFASALSQCIREAAARGAAAFERWGDGCIQPTFKVDVQAEVLGETVTAFEEKYGYQAALWCTFYSARMSRQDRWGAHAAASTWPPSPSQWPPHAIPM